MIKNPDASRGIEEVSRYFLTGARKEGNLIQASSEGNVHTLSIIHLNSISTQAFLVANMAIELSRRRFNTYIWDCQDQVDMGARHMMSGLSVKSEGNAEYRVQLYGLPDIRIYTPRHEHKMLIKALEKTCNTLHKECFVLVNDNKGAEFIHGIDASMYYVLITQTDRMSLLRCYVQVKSMLLRTDSRAKIFIIFDAREEGLAHKISVELSYFLYKKLSYPLIYLGCLTRDEYMMQCIENRMPIVTSSDASMAKGKLIFMLDRILGEIKTPTTNEASAR